MPEQPPYRLEASSQDWTPFAAGQMKHLRDDEAVLAGFWRCTVAEQPGVWEGEFERDETILVLRGRVRIEVVGGAAVELGPGDSGSFVQGTVGRWQILEDYEQFFVYA